MELAKCISIRETFPKQIKVGKYYWIDLDSMSNDPVDNERFVDVYEGYEEKVKIGRLSLNHFTINFRYLEYSGLEIFIDSKTDFILADIISWCKNNRPTHQVAQKLLEYIKDHNLDIPENMMKGFTVNSMSYRDSCRTGKLDEYEKYLGYSLQPVE